MELEASCEAFLHECNHHRAHSAIGGLIPVARVHELPRKYMWGSSALILRIVFARRRSPIAHTITIQAFGAHAFASSEPEAIATRLIALVNGSRARS